VVDIEVRVVPRARRDEIAGERDGRLLVRVAAPPVEGKANAAVVKLLAKALGVPKSRVTIARGEASRDKTVRVEGVGAGAVERLRRGTGASG
jgi:uncharacterized protein